MVLKQQKGKQFIADDKRSPFYEIVILLGGGTLVRATLFGGAGGGIQSSANRGPGDGCNNTHNFHNFGTSTNQAILIYLKRGSRLILMCENNILLLTKVQSTEAIFSKQNRLLNMYKKNLQAKRIFKYVGNFFVFVRAYAGRWEHRVHVDWQRPLSALSGVHSIMMEKLAQAGEGGGCTPTPLHSIYHHVQSFRYTPPISSLPLFVLCGWGVSMTLPTMSSPVPLISVTNIVSIMSLITMTYFSCSVDDTARKKENNSSPVSAIWVKMIHFKKKFFRNSVTPFL